MEQLGFQGGGPGTSAHTEAMQGVVKLYILCEASIQYPHHCLPKDLNQVDATEVAITLWDQDEGMSVTLLCKVTLAES